MKHLVFVLALLGTGTGCSLFGLNESSERSTEKLVLELAEGETKELPPFKASLTFVEKLEDSRCPINVACAWAGQASVLLEYTPVDNDPVGITLTGYVPAEGDGAVTVDTLGLRFTLLRLEPYPVYEQPDDDPARATVRVEERADL